MRGLTNKPSVSGPNLIDSTRNYVSQPVTVYARIMGDVLTPAYFGWLPQRRSQGSRTEPLPVFRSG